MKRRESRWGITALGLVLTGLGGNSQALHRPRVPIQFCEVGGTEVSTKLRRHLVDTDPVEFHSSASLAEACEQQLSCDVLVLNLNPTQVKGTRFVELAQNPSCYGLTRSPVQVFLASAKGGSSLNTILDAHERGRIFSPRTDIHVWTKETADQAWIALEEQVGQTSDYLHNLELKISQRQSFSARSSHLARAK